jgi:serpin B
MGLKPGLASANQLPGFSDGLKIGRVRQKTWLTVDEAGTEAAAATVAEATRTAAGPKAVSVSFDKPFIYALRHRPTGTILMIGYVGDPDSSAQPAATETPPASDVSR